MTYDHPKSFALQFGALLTLYICISSILVLLFGVVNIRYPDEASSWYQDEAARDMIRTSIAILVVFFPAYLGLTRHSNRSRAANLGAYTILTKWLVYLSLLVGGVALLADLATLIYFFLNGEVTIRFLHKVVIFFAVVASAVTFYVYDIRGHFSAHPKLLTNLALSATLFVALSVIAGFMYIETPQAVREIRLDERQVEDLRDIQFRIEEYYAVRSGFPESIDDLYVGETTPQAPSARPQYRYIMTGPMTYQLCATFIHESQSLGRHVSPAFPIRDTQYTWDHGAGEKCFDRVITGTETDR